MPEDDPFISAGEAVKTLINTIVPPNASSVTGFFSAWESIAGLEMATNVYPRDIVNNQLILETSHPGWSQKVEMRKESLLYKVQKRYPQLEIQQIRIVLERKGK